MSRLGVSKKRGRQEVGEIVELPAQVEDEEATETDSERRGLLDDLHDEEDEGEEEEQAKANPEVPGMPRLPTRQSSRWDVRRLHTMKHLHQMRRQHVTNLMALMRQYTLQRNVPRLAQVVAQLLEAQGPRPDSLKSATGLGAVSEAQARLAEVLVTGYTVLRDGWPPGPSPAGPPPTWDQLRRLLRQSHAYLPTPAAKDGAALELVKLTLAQGDLSGAYDILDTMPARGEGDPLAFDRSLLGGLIRHTQWMQVMQRPGSSRGAQEGTGQRRHSGGLLQYDPSRWAAAGRVGKELFKEAGAHLQRAYRLRPCSTELAYLLVQRALASEGGLAAATRISEAHRQAAPADVDAHALHAMLLVMHGGPELSADSRRSALADCLLCMLRCDPGNQVALAAVLELHGTGSLPPSRLLSLLCAYLDAAPPSLRPPPPQLQAWQLLAASLLAPAQRLVSTYNAVQQAQQRLSRHLAALLQPSGGGAQGGEGEGPSGGGALPLEGQPPGSHPAAEMDMGEGGDSASQPVMRVSGDASPACSSPSGVGRGGWGEGEEQVLGAGAEGAPAVIGTGGAAGPCRPSPSRLGSVEGAGEGERGGTLGGEDSAGGVPQRCLPTQQSQHAERDHQPQSDQCAQLAQRDHQPQSDQGVQHAQRDLAQAGAQGAEGEGEGREPSTRSMTASEADEVYWRLGEQRRELREAGEAWREAAVCMEGCLWWRERHFRAVPPPDLALCLRSGRAQGEALAAQAVVAAAVHGLWVQDRLQGVRRGEVLPSNLRNEFTRGVIRALREHGDAALADVVHHDFKAVTEALRVWRALHQRPPYAVLGTLAHHAKHAADFKAATGKQWKPPPGWAPIPLGLPHPQLGPISSLLPAWWQVFPQTRRGPRTPEALRALQEPLQGEQEMARRGVWRVG